MSVVTLLFCVAVVLLLFHYIFSNAQNRISFSLLGIGEKIKMKKELALGHCLACVAVTFAPVYGLTSRGA